MQPYRNLNDSSVIGRHYLGTSHSDIVGSTSFRDEFMSAGGGGHYGYPDFPPGKVVGGSFGLNSFVRSAPVAFTGKVIRPGAPIAQYYDGSLLPTFGDLGSVAGNLATISSTMGSNAYSMMKPTQPNFQGLNAAYELRELPEQLRQRFLKDGLKAIPNYWLALQFGWKPLLNDIRNFVLTQVRAQTRLNQLMRDNGRPVRRRISLFDNSDAPTYVERHLYQVFSPGLVTQFYPYEGTARQSTVNYDRAWASARFRYWLPEGPRDVNWTRAMKARIFGLYPSPSVVWNALPWTWLADWFVDIGTMLQNTEAGVANRLAADYYYVMREKGARQTNECTSPFYDQNGGVFTVSGTAYSQWSHKTREIGDPFGWNTAENNLSGMQLSILGALGMSRLRP